MPTHVLCRDLAKPGPTPRQISRESLARRPSGAGGIRRSSSRTCSVRPRSYPRSVNGNESPGPTHRKHETAAIIARVSRKHDICLEVFRQSLYFSQYCSVSGQYVPYPTDRAEFSANGPSLNVRIPLMTDLIELLVSGNGSSPRHRAAGRRPSRTHRQGPGSCLARFELDPLWA